MPPGFLISLACAGKKVIKMKRSRASYAMAEATAVQSGGPPILLIAAVLLGAEWLLIGHATVLDFYYSFPQALGILLAIIALGLNVWAAHMIRAVMRKSAAAKDSRIGR